MPRKDKIETMFDNIASDYDKLNHIMSLNVDRGWRKKAIRALVDGRGPIRVLDVACGTGDSTIAIAKALVRRGRNTVAGDRSALNHGSSTTEGSHVTGIDLSEGMLSVMAEKVEKEGLEEIISSLKGDAENLPFQDSSFDCIMSAFGVRNFENLARGLSEMQRVLKPGGRIAILELSMPSNKLVRKLYEIYFLHIMPGIGAKISGDKGAYRYLPASVVRFPGKEEFTGLLESCGFTSVTHRAFSLGLCRLYCASK